MTTPVSGVSGGTAGVGDTTQSSAAPDGTAGLLDPNTFLSLLVDELKYQNPLDPTDSADFMDQIAELSQVEQLQTVSSSSEIGEAAGLIGKTVTGRRRERQPDRDGDRCHQRVQRAYARRGR